MRLFPPPLNIGETEGFTPQNDPFERKHIGQGLLNLLDNVRDPLVVAVDGQWGSGKTTFLKMCAGELRNAGFGVIYFDAFQNDYAEDAFTALAAEIIALAQAKEKENTTAAKAFVEKAVGAGKVVLRSSLKVGVKLATMGALEAADFEEATDDIAKEAGELTDKYLGELLTKQGQEKGAIQAFRDALAGLPPVLTTADKPLVIIIDELDRCRPLFALQILERMKHFFAVPNVHFVLGVHLGQLRNSVLAAYGTKIEAQTYLQKFIQITLHLIDDAQHRQQRTAIKFIDYLVRAMEFRDRTVTEYAKPYFHHTAEHRNLNLRTIEQIMSTFAMALASLSGRGFSPTAIIAGLCVLKIVEPDLYVKAKAGLLTWDEARVPLGFGFPSDKQDRRSIELMADVWKYATELDFPDDDISHHKFGPELFRYGIQSRMRMVPYVASTIIDRLAMTEGRSSTDVE